MTREEAMVVFRDVFRLTRLERASWELIKSIIYRHSAEVVTTAVERLVATKDRLSNPVAHLDAACQEVEKERRREELERAAEEERRAEEARRRGPLDPDFDPEKLSPFMREVYFRGLRHVVPPEELDEE